MGTLLNLRIHYPLAAPITSQQLYRGLKCEAKHFSTCHIEFCWIEQLSPRILIKSFKRVIHFCMFCATHYLGWQLYYVLHFKNFSLILPLWFVDFACRLRTICCILPDEYFWNLSCNTSKTNENKNMHAKWLQHDCTTVMSDQHKDFADLQEKENYFLYPQEQWWIISNTPTPLRWFSTPPAIGDNPLGVCTMVRPHLLLGDNLLRVYLHYDYTTYYYSASII